MISISGVSARTREGHGAELRGGALQGEDLRHLHGDRPRQAQGRGQVLASVVQPENRRNRNFLTSGTGTVTC